MRFSVFMAALGAAAVVIALGIGGAACGGSSSAGDDPTTPDGGGDSAAGDSSMPRDGAVPPIPLGMPITATPGKWTWIDFPDTTCDDGSPTGIGLYPSATSDKLVFFFAGGGACWDYTTCVTLNTSTHGPFGATEFASLSGGDFPGTILERAGTSPFKDYNAVFVPYCTGDLHAGDAVQTYANGSASKTIKHKGHANVLAYLSRLAATFKTPSNVAVTGSSAGGGGAIFNYPSIRAAWPAASALLVDDSLPLMIGDSVGPALRTAWYQSWNLGALVDPLCAGCRDDLSLYLKTVAQRYPSDRMALLSSLQDKTIRGYFLLTPVAFEAALRALIMNVLVPLPNFRSYVETGEGHTMLAALATHTTNGTPLVTWLTQMTTGDAAWVSIVP